MNFLAPVFSKDGNKLFAIGRLPKGEIVRYDSDTHAFLPWLRGFSAGLLSFSHDGRWMSYVTFPSGALWRARIDGSERLQLTQPSMEAEFSSWSPDAKRLAFHAYSGNTKPNIYVISADGGKPEQLLPGGSGAIDPNWSPDGNSLLFGSPLDDALKPDKLTLHILDLKTHKVATLPGSNGLFAPRWSLDGRYVAASRRYGLNQMLMLYNFQTQSWSELFRGLVHFRSWSHDSRYVYFDSAVVGADRPAIFRVGLSDRRLTKVADLTGFPAVLLPRLQAWFGLAPDDSPLVLRDISTEEIYALNWQSP
jgi:Tol biopolymer transport system component